MNTVVVELCFSVIMQDTSVMSRRCLRIRRNFTRSEINGIYHRSLMQTEKSLPEGKRMMPETRFTELPTLSIDPRVEISRSALKTNA